MPDGFNALQKEVRSASSRAPDFLSLDDAINIEDACNKAVCMEYQDADGNKSKRWVTIRSIDEYEPTPKFFAYCWVRRELRSFRADRVETFIDHDGECISGRDFFEGIGIDLPPPSASSPSRSDKKSRQAGSRNIHESKKYSGGRTTSPRAQMKEDDWGHTYESSGYSGGGTTSPLAQLKAAEERIRAGKKTSADEKPETGSVIGGFVIIGVAIYLVSLLF